MKALLVAFLIFLLMSFLVLVLVLPGQVKDCLAGPYMCIVATLAIVLAVGLIERLTKHEGEKP